MFCENCGAKKEEGAIFCYSCGKKEKTVSEKDNLETTKVPTESISSKSSMDIFYSKEWRRKKSFVLSALPPYDVMVDNQYLYIIKLPKYSGSATGLILGLIIANILGAYIGSSIGESSDEKKRKWYRSAWLDNSDKLTSRAYESDIFIKIPVNSLKNNISFDKSFFVVNYNGEKIKMGRRVRSFRSPDKKESIRLKQYIQKYVL